MRQRVLHDALPAMRFLSGARRAPWRAADRSCRHLCEYSIAGIDAVASRRGYECGMS